MSCQWTAVADKEAGKGPGRPPRDEGVEVERRKLQRKGSGMELESRNHHVGRESLDVQETPYHQDSENDEKEEKESQYSILWSPVAE